MKKFGIFSDKADMLLLSCSVLAALIGIFIINSASYSLDSHIRYMVVQSVAFILGLLAMTGIIFFNYRHFEKLRFLIFTMGIGLLVLVLLVGRLSHGTQGWLVVGPFRLQPSEIAKICFIITSSYHIAKCRDSLNSLKTLSMLSLHFLCYVIPVLLQPDFGTATVFLVIFLAELFFAGLAVKYILWGCGAIAVLSPAVWFFLADYQKNRILALFFPEKDPTGSGYHILQSKLAIGSGMIWGRGYLNGPQTQYGYLPEKQTDFIFSVIGEEFGIIGTLLVSILLFIIVYRCFDNAKNCSYDSFAEFMCIGIGSMLFFHIVENIGMCIGLLPITGIPLPFISYGGSNLVTCFASVGIVQSIRMRRRAVKFNL